MAQSLDPWHVFEEAVVVTVPVPHHTDPTPDPVEGCTWVEVWDWESAGPQNPAPLATPAAGLSFEIVACAGSSPLVVRAIPTQAPGSWSLTGWNVHRWVLFQSYWPFQEVRREEDYINYGLTLSVNVDAEGMRMYQCNPEAWCCCAQ